MAPWIATLVGTLASLYVSTQLLGWEVWTCLRAIALTNLAGYLALVATLQAERVSWLKRNILPSTLPTWLFFLALYFTPTLVGVEELRHWDAWVRMLFPLMFTNGFSIAAFGPTQDFFVRHSQRKSLGIVGPVRLKARVRAEIRGK